MIINFFCLFALADSTSKAQHLFVRSFKMAMASFKTAADEMQDISRSNFGDMLWDLERNFMYKRAIEKVIKKLVQMEKMKKEAELASQDDTTCPKASTSPFSRKCQVEPKDTGPKMRLLDIGIGAGMLTLFACRAMASQPYKKNYEVIALEQFQPTHRVASKVLLTNNYRSNVNLLLGNSLNLKWKEQLGNPKASFLFCELFDTELLGEGALHSYQFANETQLENGAPRVPSRARVYAQLITSSHFSNIDQFKRLHLHIQDGNPINGITVEPPVSEPSCPGLRRCFDMHLDELKDVRPVSEIVNVFEFDFCEENGMPYESHRMVNFNLLCSPNELETPVVLAFWWDSPMDLEGEYLMSCAPYWARFDVDYGRLMFDTPGRIVYQYTLLTLFTQERCPHPRIVASNLDSLNLFLRRLCSMPKKDFIERWEMMFERVAKKKTWRDHWMQMVHLMPATFPMFVRDHQVQMMALHNDYEFWFRFATKDESNDAIRLIMKGTTKKYSKDFGLKKLKANKNTFFPLCQCPTHPKMMANLIKIINDTESNQNFVNQVRKLFPDPNVTLNILVHCTYHYMPVIVARLLPNSNIYLYPDANCQRDKFFESLIESNDLSARITLIKNLDELASLNEPIEAVISDINCSTNAVGFERLTSYWKTIEKVRCLRLGLRRADRLILLPSKCSIKFTLVCFDHLWKLHIPVKRVDGFNFQPYSEMIQNSSKSDDDVDHQYLFEYPSISVSERVFTVYKIDFNHALKEGKRKQFLFDLDRAKIERDMRTQYGDNLYDYENQWLDELQPFVRSLTNLAMIFWTDFEELSSYGLKRPLRYLEQIQWNPLFLQGVHFLNKYDLIVPNPFRTLLDFNIFIQLNLLGDMKLKIESY